MNNQILTNRQLVDQYKTWAAEYDGRVSDDTSESPKAILEQMIFVRAALIRKAMEADINSYRYSRQTIPCIPLEKADKNSCPCAPASGCHWAVTQYRIPNPIGQLISVDGVYGDIRYSYIEWNAAKYKIKSRIEADRKRPYYSIRDGYLYLHQDQYKEFVSVTGTFGDPLAVQTYPDCEGNVECCTPYLDLEFPIDPILIEELYVLTHQALRQSKATLNIDEFNNDKKDTRFL